jgi:N-acetylneuraminic acid mutarotase
MTNAERIQANNAELQECLNLAKNIVKPSGTLTIDKNGTHDVTAFESVDVDVKSTGGPELNIAYGDTPPEDTRKLWVKTSEPNKVIVSTNVTKSAHLPIESIEILSETLSQTLYNMGTALVDNNVYLFGGYAEINTIYYFDIETNIITLISTLPSNNSSMSVGVVGKKVYLLGGYKDYRIHCYDTETNFITTMGSTFTKSISDMGTATVDNKIYLFGGVYNSTYFSDIRCYDPESDSLITLDCRLPTACRSSYVAVIDKNVYILGGRYSSTYLTDIHVFNTVTQNISTLSTKLSRSSVGGGLGVIGTNIYMLGGISDGSTINMVYRFNVANNTISSAKSLTSANYGMGSATVGTKIYLFGGNGSGSGTKIEVYSADNPNVLLDNGDLLLSVGFNYENYFDLMSPDIPNMETGIFGVYKGKSDGTIEEVKAYLYKNDTWKLV